MSGVHKFLKDQDPAENSRLRVGGIKHIFPWGPANVRRHRGKFVHPWYVYHVIV